jgi:ribosomal-protein-alanine N-acetyltransferase
VVTASTTRLRVELTAPSAHRAAEFLAAASRSRAFHRGLVTVPATLDAYGDYLARCSEQRVLSHFVVLPRRREIVGVVELLDLVPGPAASARLAYYAFVPHAGKGLVTEGARLAVARAFRELDFEVLTADVQRSNGRSAAVLEKLGFRPEAPPVVRKVGRRWLEHARWRLSRDEWRCLG